MFMIKLNLNIKSCICTICNWQGVRTGNQALRMRAPDYIVCSTGVLAIYLIGQKWHLCSHGGFEASAAQPKKRSILYQGRGNTIARTCRFRRWSWRDSARTNQTLDDRIGNTILGLLRMNNIRTVLFERRNSKCMDMQTGRIEKHGLW